MSYKYDTYKVCSCGWRYSQMGYEDLPLLGVQVVPAGISYDEPAYELVVRSCSVCKSSLSVAR